MLIHLLDLLCRLFALVIILTFADGGIISLPVMFWAISAVFHRLF